MQFLNFDISKHFLKTNDLYAPTMRPTVVGATFTVALDATVTP